MKTTSKMINEWVDLYVNKHLNCGQIAKMYNGNRSIIRYHLNCRGILTPHPKTHSYPPVASQLKNVICVYDLDDNLCWQFDSTREMAKTFNKPLNCIQCHISPSRINRKFRYNGKWYRIYLIEV